MGQDDSQPWMGGEHGRELFDFFGQRFAAADLASVNHDWHGKLRSRVPERFEAWILGRKRTHGAMQLHDAQVKLAKGAVHEPRQFLIGGVKRRARNEPRVVRHFARRPFVDAFRHASPVRVGQNPGAIEAIGAHAFGYVWQQWPGREPATRAEAFAYRQRQAVREAVDVRIDFQRGRPPQDSPHVTGARARTKGCGTVSSCSAPVEGPR